MNWNIIAFESDRGEKYVEEFIKSLDSSTIAKVGHAIDLLEQHGSILGMPHSKKLNSDIYELRIRGKQEIRILYGFKARNIPYSMFLRNKHKRLLQKR